jgi:hypothetical protein
VLMLLLVLLRCCYMRCTYSGGPPSESVLFSSLATRSLIGKSRTAPEGKDQNIGLHTVSVSQRATAT